MPAPDDGRRVKPSLLYSCAVAAFVVSGVTAAIGAPLLGWWVLLPILGGLAISLCLVATATVARAAWKHRYQVFTHLRENADPDER